MDARAGIFTYNSFIQSILFSINKYTFNKPFDYVVMQKTIEELLNDLIKKIKEISLVHNEYTVFKIVKTLYFSCFSLTAKESVLNEIQSLLSQIIKSLLKRVVNVPKLDLQLGLSCLFMLSDQEASKWLSTTSKS